MTEQSPRVLVARCDNYREDVDAPCTGEIRFRWGMSQSDPCDVCGSRCGIAVAAWERVELPTPAHPANCQSCSGLLTDHDCDDRRWSLVAFERCFAAGPAAASPPGDTEKAHEVAEAMLGRLADKLTSLRRRLATAMGHDEVPDDDGLVKDVAWYVQMLRARDDTVPAGSVECDQCGGRGVTGPSGDTVQAREQILQRDITFGEYVIAVCDAIGLPHDSPRAAVVEAIRAAVAAAQAPESPTDSTPKAGRGGSGEAETATDTVQAPDVAVERQARYQETACARRPAEEHPDA